MNDRQRWAVLMLAMSLLVSSLLCVLTIARYEALRDEIASTCPSAAALDLTSWIPICKRVGYQQMIMPEDWER